MAETLSTTIEKLECHKIEDISKRLRELGVVVHACGPSMQETETGEP